MASDEKSREPGGDAGQGEPDVLRGPHGWLNWRAEREGRPVRSSPLTATHAVLPSWGEYALYSDSYIRGQLKLGPHEFVITLPVLDQRVGNATMQVVLRWYDHLPDVDPRDIDWETEDVSDYYGGDLGDEFAALLALALGRRLRSGGLIRRGYADAIRLGSRVRPSIDRPCLSRPRGARSCRKSPALRHSKTRRRLCSNTRRSRWMTRWP